MKLDADTFEKALNKFNDSFGKIVKIVLGLESHYIAFQNADPDPEYVAERFVSIGKVLNWDISSQTYRFPCVEIKKGKKSAEINIASSDGNSIMPIYTNEELMEFINAFVAAYIKERLN